jgi:hypothetical protein
VNRRLGLELCVPLAAQVPAPYDRPKLPFVHFGEKQPERPANPELGSHLFELAIGATGHVDVTFDADDRPYPTLACQTEIEVEQTTLQIIEAGGFLPEWSVRLRETCSRARERLIDDWAAAFQDFYKQAWPVYERCRQLAEILRQFAPELSIAASLTLRPVFRISTDGRTFRDSPFHLPERPDWESGWLARCTRPYHARKKAPPLFSEAELGALTWLVRERGRGLHSLKFLLRACRTLDKEMRFLFGAIAAELAAKEILITLVPTLAPLVAKAHGPSVDVYYGRLLESYGFEESPKKAAIKKGLERRNKLVHRAGLERDRTDKTDDLDEAAATEYIDDVRDAIVHLLSLSDDLRPLAAAVARYRQTPLPTWSDDASPPAEFEQFSPVRELDRQLPGNVDVDYSDDERTVLVRVWSEDSDAKLLFERELSFEQCFDDSAVGELQSELAKLGSTHQRGRKGR